MQTPIDQMETMVEIGAKALFDAVQMTMDSLGNRPFMSSHMTERQELEAYNALRLTQDGLYHYADGIRAELDARLADFTAEERLALGVSDSEIRRIACMLSLKYFQRMNKLSAKLGIPIEGLELVPEPLPPEAIELGGEEWQESTMPVTMDLGMDLAAPPPPFGTSSSTPLIQEPALSLPAQPPILAPTVEQVPF